jgi:hypothetical protein
VWYDVFQNSCCKRFWAFVFLNLFVLLTLWFSLYSTPEFCFCLHWPESVSITCNQRTPPDQLPVLCHFSLCFLNQSVNLPKAQCPCLEMKIKMLNFLRLFICLH